MQLASSASLANPFLRVPSRSREPPSTQGYIRMWVDRILMGVRVGPEARADINRRLGFNQGYNISTTSSIATLIYDRVRDICLRQKQILDLSACALHRQAPQLSVLTDHCSAWAQFKRTGELEAMEGVFLSWGQVYLLAYRYLCQSARELHHLWKALQDCAETRDKSAADFRKGLSSLMLDVFAEGKHLQPTAVLPTLPFALKCRFIYADATGIERREELTRFHEDLTVRRLIAHSAHHGCNCGSPLCGDRAAKMVRLKPAYRNIPQKNCARPIRQVAAELPLELASARVEVEETIVEESIDESSDGGLQYEFGRDELIEGGEVFEMEVSPNPEKHSFNRETEGSSKLSSSSGNEDHLEKVQQQAGEREREIERERERERQGQREGEQQDEGGLEETEFQPQAQQQQQLDCSSSSCWGDASGSDDIDLNEQFQLGAQQPVMAKIQRLRHNLHYLYPQYPSSTLKQTELAKLDKHRKILQSEKQKLLQEIDSYTAERNNEKGLLSIMKDTKRNSRTLCKCLPQNAQIYSRMKDHKERLETLSQGRQWGKSEGEERESERESEGEVGLSRRQQKLKRKQERALESKKMERSKAEKHYLCEQEANLSNFLESMQIDPLARVACRVEEDRLDGWSARIASLRQLKDIRPSPAAQSPPKKKKGRR